MVWRARDGEHSSGRGAGSSRRGLTVLELLCVVSVLALLTALILPAVQRGRAAARRVQCANNLRELALACSAHQATFNRLPGGGWGYTWRYDPARGSGPRQPGGWAGAVLPYLEREDLLRPLETTSPAARDAAMRELLGTGIAVFNCPERPDGATGPVLPGYPPLNAPQMTVAGKTDYAANAGSVVVQDQRGPPSLTDGDRGGPAEWRTVEPEVNGVVFQRSWLDLSKIPDGVGQTYLLAEKYVSTVAYDTDDDLGHDQSLLSGVDMDTVRWTADPPLPDGEAGGRDTSHRFGSAHAAGFNAAFCDGRVRFLDYDLDPDVHRWQGDRDDGRVWARE